MKKIYSSQNRVLIYLLKSKLEERHIPCFLKNENPPLAGEIPPILAWPELWVEDELASKAKTIIEEELEHEQETKTNWICAQCGEHLEGAFNICWQCGSTRE